jgi:hypothetical protein
MWIHNLACEPAQYIDTWQNSDAGILNLVEALFKMPLETVAAALQVDVTAAQVSPPPPPSLLSPVSWLTRTAFQVGRAGLAFYSTAPHEGSCPLKLVPPSFPVAG